MRNRKLLAGVLCGIIFFGTISSVAQAKKSDVKGSSDHPLVTRMPDFYIDRYETNEFDSEKFKTADGNVTVEGRKFVIYYSIQPDATPPGKPQILQNYLNAFSAVGADVMLKGSYYYIFRLKKDNMETWVKVDPGNDDGKRYILTIVEKAVMEQAVFADAEAMAKGIMASGHMAVYGIYFDSGKSVVKEESDETLAEIAKLLGGNPGLKLYVAGHTDADGSLEYNMGLSDDRAKAVVEALTSRYGVDSDRLYPKGLGPLAPVASNRTQDGKAKNRRVELVEKLD